MIIALDLILNLFVLAVQQSNTTTYNSISPNDFSNYICYTTNEKISIDGKLNENSWKFAPFSNSFVDIEGENKPTPLHDTRIKILWDEEYLYIGALLDETHIWATYTDRESVIFHENDFEIFIDPNGDTHNYYEIEVNALNTIWDLLLIKPYRDLGRAITSWDLKGMKSAVYIEGTINDPSDIDEYWSVEFAFPWSALKEHAFENRKPKHGEQWRMNFSRVQWKLDIIDGAYSKQINPKTKKYFPEDNWVWSSQSVINMHRPEIWGYVQFSDIIVGSSKTKFVFNEDEYCKWELRKIYYAQKAFKNQHRKFTDKLGKLNYSNEYCLNATIEMKTSEFEFEATIQQPGKNNAWIINSEGLIWSE